MNRAKMHAEIARAIHEIKNNNYDGQPITRIKDVIDSYVTAEIERVTEVDSDMIPKWCDPVREVRHDLAYIITTKLREREKRGKHMEEGIFMDNRVFNINGKGDEFLLSVLKMAFKQSDAKDCKGWLVTRKGLILLQYGDEKMNRFPVPLSAEGLFPVVSAWLKDCKTDDVEMPQWDHNCDHDGHNTVGWRVYVEDWGNVDNHYGVICAIKPVFLWHGK